MRSPPSLSLSGSKPTATTTASARDARSFAASWTTVFGRMIPTFTLGPPQLPWTKYSKRILCEPAVMGSRA